MKTYNADQNLLNKVLIRQAVFTVCSNKHKRNGKPTRKYKLARRMMDFPNPWIEKTYDIIDAYIKVHQATESKQTPDQKLVKMMYRPTQPKYFTTV